MGQQGIYGVKTKFYCQKKAEDNTSIRYKIFLLKESVENTNVAYITRHHRQKKI